MCCINSNLTSSQIPHMRFNVYYCYTLSEQNVVQHYVFQLKHYKFVEDFMHTQNPYKV